jgi:hypothetical protein
LASNDFGNHGSEDTDKRINSARKSPGAIWRASLLSASVLKRLTIDTVLFRQQEDALEI